VLPGRHQPIAERLWGGRTLPVLELDGRAIGDSTRIIEELERLHPEPPIYPSDSPDRLRALELEDFFDEELGPHARLLVFHHMLPDAGLMLGAFTPDLRGFRRLAARVMFGRARPRIKAMLGIDESSVERAWQKIAAAGERFRAEVGPRGYLVGGRFTVADLTVASLVAPIVAPEEFPYPQPQRGHPRLAPVRDALAPAGLLEWAQEMYARHRGTSAEIRPTPSP
jgi:glutathione S-transferase